MTLKYLNGFNAFLWKEQGYIQLTHSPFKLPTNIYFVLYPVLETLANFPESEKRRHSVHKKNNNNKTGK